MIITLSHSTATNPPLPPTLIKLTNSNDILLVELQGSLATDGDTSGQFVGVLAFDPSTPNVSNKFCYKTSISTPSFLRLFSEKKYYTVASEENREPSLASCSTSRRAASCSWSFSNPRRAGTSFFYPIAAFLTASSSLYMSRSRSF